DLWKVCQTYGTVVDVYIPNRRSKAGKRFAFVRFIRVDNVVRLVGNLCTLWIGRMHLRANVVRFERSPIYLPRSAQPINPVTPATPSFVLALKDVLEAVHCSDDESIKGVEEDNVEASNLNNLKAESDSEAIFYTYIRDNADEQVSENESVQSSNAKEVVNDPFNIYDLLNKRNKEVGNSGKDTSIPYPPGFTPEMSTHNNVDQEVKDAEHIQSHGRSEGCSSRILDDAEKFDERFSSEDRVNGVKHKEGGSILELLDEMIKVSQTIGFSMQGCSKDMEKIIRSQGVHETKMETISAMDIKFLYGNYIFDHILNASLGNSGGILCTWDPNVFHKEHHIISDNFVALYGTWIPNRMKLLVILVYAPQSASSKRMLWRYISSFITRWNGESMVMGDFNEVRRMEERWGSTFNAQGASVFNSFITSSGLIDVQLEGDLKSKLSDINKELDQGGVNDDLLLSRMDAMKQLQDVKSSKTNYFMQKAKVRWAIEGDENYKFFHGIINRKRGNLSVKGIMVDGEWVDEPSRVKDEFRIHFAARFQDPGNSRGRLNFNFPNRLNLEQVSDLESPISRDEIRNAVWGCGKNKSPGPDGFTFEFFRCKSSFIALIPKTLDPKTAFLPNRQILDGPFIINEILSRCNQKNQHAIVFKVDFAKAYDYIRWDYLDDVLKSFGFGSKWCSWIRGSLNSGKASILVNGSPNFEFQFHRGLKQGGPLAPYLFILIMESLHLSFTRVIEAGLSINIKKVTSLELKSLILL
nr:RNA-directed DNA polymerase, eukaryota [Tanacetum cinerariifolium]GEZ18937.1 RNA-directed DNA polymerase, eukaryota [Tanacetum cinerariifolium]